MSRPVCALNDPAFWQHSKLFLQHDVTGKRVAQGEHPVRRELRHEPIGEVSGLVFLWFGRACGHTPEPIRPGDRSSV
jgi:hypothetical protein